MLSVASSAAAAASLTLSAGVAACAKADAGMQTRINHAMNAAVVAIIILFFMVLIPLLRSLPDWQGRLNEFNR
jgi:xanthine/uracil/vitamin C permease (AzgA family)